MCSDTILFEDNMMSVIETSSGKFKITNKLDNDTILCTYGELSKAIDIMENNYKVEAIANRLNRLGNSLIGIRHNFIRTNEISTMVDEKLNPLAENLKDHVDYYALENYSIGEINEICRR